MPFTLAHPLLPVIFKKVKPGLSLTAMIAGSMIPDMENFFKMQDTDSLGHELPGILLFDIPAALILCFVYHHLVRNPFISHLPSRFRSRFAGALEFDWNRYAVQHKGILLVSLSAGIFSHFAWDGFTHQDGYFVQWLPWLSHKVSWYPRAVPLHYVFQLLSSIGGLLLLYLVILQKPVQKSMVTPIVKGRFYWPLFALCFFILLFTRLYFWPGLNSYLDTWRAGMGSLLYSWIIVSILYNRSFYSKKAEIATAERQAD